MAEEDRDARETLNGWKEIAAFLGKSVRSVQRWERDLGLPVRRINTPDQGQIVYASREEIEGWRRRMNQRKVSLEDPEAPKRAEELRPADTPEPSDGEATRPTLVPAAVTPARSRLGGVAVVMTVLLLGIVVGRWSVRPAHETDHIEYTGGAVTGLARDGQVIWRHDLGQPAWQPGAVSPFPVDLEGDGSIEFIVPVRYGPQLALTPSRSDEVLCFRGDGTLVWRITPAPPLTQSGRSFDAPWLLRGVVSPGAAAGGRSWMAFSHHTWSPGVIVEVASDGDERLRFVQDGWITSLAFWPTSHGGVLAAGGLHHGRGHPAVALLHLDAPPAAAPTTPERRLTCDDCPTEGPAAYFLLPPTEVADARGQLHPQVSRLSVTQSGLVVATDDHQVGLISPELEFEGLEYSDSYWAAHRRLELERRLDHASEDCPQRSAPRHVSLWTASAGWTTELVATAASGSKD